MANSGEYNAYQHAGGHGGAGEGAELGAGAPPPSSMVSDPRQRVAPAAEAPVSGGASGGEGAAGGEKSLIRPAVTALVKEFLMQPFKSGNITKDQFKTIAKKAVDKVVGAIPSSGVGSVPNTIEGLESFVTEARKVKIKKLVEGYVGKYNK